MIQNFMLLKKIATDGRCNQDIEKFAGDLPLHMPPVQFATLMSLPWQDRPPWLGGGSSHNLLLVCVQALPHTDHADHLDHCPSTAGKKKSKIETSFRSESLRRVRSTCSDNKKARQTGLVTRTYLRSLVGGRPYLSIRLRLLPLHQLL